MSIFEELKRRNVFRVGVAYGVAAWVLLQVADLVLENINAPEWVIQALMLVVGLGFIAALVIAWAYEMTPEGIRREADVDRSRSISSDTAKKLDRIVIGFLLVAVAVLLYRQSGVPEMGSEPFSQESAGQKSEAQIEQRALTPAEASQAKPKPTSVAVLPFANMSADPDNEYFSDGISEELLNLLVRIEGLRVPSRTSSFAFKGMNIDIKEIAQQLNVGHILEGSVRKAGNRVRVTAQLIDVSTDTHLWSETYDRELEDIFAIQDEIANHIVNALKLALGTSGLVSREDEKPTDDLLAYEEYLRGRHLFLQRGLKSLYTSMELLQSAVARDPDFSEAWAQLSQTAITLSGWAPGYQKDIDELAIEAGLRALQLDANSANAMAGVGLAYYYQTRWQESLDMFEKAEPLSRDSNPVYWYGLVLQSAGYLQEARLKLLAAEQLDPAYPQLQYWLGLNDMTSGQTNQARLRFQRTIDGNNPNGPYGMFWLHLQEGEIAVAVERLQELQLQSDTGGFAEVVPENFQAMTAALLDPAKKDQAVRAARAEEFLNLLSWLGAFTEILDLERERISMSNTQEVNNDMGQFFWSPDFRPLRQLPGFKELLRELGLVDLWKTRGWPDLCRPLGEDDFECD